VLPPSEELSKLLDRMVLPPGAPGVPGPLAAVPRHLDLLQRLVPEARCVLEALGEALAGFPERAGEVPVHGDFYEAQVMVRDGHVSGLLDLETVGLGRRVNDWACLCGHLSVRQETANPRSRRRIGS
jgi:Ser/Thr protein kinase RdoA (MazF antagonist)